MSDRTWRGDAPAVAQVNTVTPASVTVGNVFTLTINGKAVSFTATAATVANVTAGLTDAVNNSTIPEFLELTAADGTTELTLTAKTAGVPFTQTSSSATGSGSAGHSLATATTTASSGPNDWGVASNWTGAAVPVDGDDVYISDSNVDILYSLDQSGVDLVSLNIAGTFTGKLGLPDTNPGSGGGSYYEYRTKHLTLTADTVEIGAGGGGGSGRIKLSLGANATTINVHNTGNPVDSGVPSLVIVGDAANYTLNVTKGNVGCVACQLPTIRLSYTSDTVSDVVLTLDADCTLTTITQGGGSLTVNSNVTTLNLADGVCNFLAGTLTTLNQDGGTLYYQSTGTITTVNLGTDAALDFGRDLRSRTITNCTVQAKSTLRDPFKTLTFTNPFLLDRCSLAEVTLDLGSNFFLQRS